MNLIEYLESRAKPYLLILALALIILIGTLDYFADPRISFRMLYLLPILLVVWMVGHWAGIALAVCTTAAWFISNIITVPTPYSLNVYSNHFILSWNVAVEMSVSLTFVYLLSGLKRILEHEKELARTDYLTGVANKRFFFEFANMELNRARRYKRPFATVYMDVDNFKTVNDTLGHEAGDNLLRIIARTIKENLRRTDIIARLGGDEFVILMPETGLEPARAAVERIQKFLKEMVKEKKFPVSFSIGTVAYPVPPKTVDEMMKEVDDLMYTAKKKGKNRALYSQRKEEPLQSTPC